MNISERQHISGILTGLYILAAVSGAAGQPAAPEVNAPSSSVDFADACSRGSVKDDGSAETGYGWVPSAIEGIYVQEFQLKESSTPYLDSVCVCWLRTRSDEDIDFEVVFYEQVMTPYGIPIPTDQPYAAVPAHADAVPQGVTGRFYEVPVDGVDLRGETTYIGVRWNPSLDPFFFVCTDTTPTSAPVGVFFKDDRAGGWGSVFYTSDPIFTLHRAILVRATALNQLDVPTLDGWGIAVLVVLLAAAGLFVSRRHRLTL